MVFHFFLSLMLLLSSPCIGYQRPAEQISSAVTYELNGGRLGDNLISYVRAKWISYYYKIPLIFLPFKHSDKLALDTLEHQREGTFVNTVEIDKNTVIDPHSSTLYVSTWYSPLRPQWNDQEFLKIVRAHIAPVNPYATVDIPSNCFSVAVHVRTGSGFDNVCIQKQKPQQFPSTAFYIKLMRIIASLYPTQRIYFHIFTDDPKPEKFVCTFQKALSDPRISFGYRKSDTKHTSGVLDDFFAMMMNFDALIRPASHYSMWAERLGHHELILKPAYTYKPGKQGRINNIILLRKTEAGWKKTLLPPAR
jgi:hypothetical protein